MRLGRSIALTTCVPRSPDGSGASPASPPLHLARRSLTIAALSSHPEFPMQSNEPGGAEARYFSALNQGRFVIQRCAGCGNHVFYPRSICPHCSSDRLEWVEPKGTGTVYSATTVRRKPEAGGDYNVSLIELAEGVRMMSRVDGVPPAEVRIGMPVRAKVIQHNGAGLVVFEPEAVR
jgi:uncharacterized OB-fold protein